MQKLFYMGLEPYEGRYTLQLEEWSRRAFQRRDIDWVNVPGTTIDNTKAIQVGQVLDAHGRSYFAMSQMMNLVQMMRNGEVTGKDVIFFEDMFQPGMESLPYIMDQIPAEQRPQVWIRCLAQAVDPDDFVHVWGMGKWMSLYEEMCNEFVTGVLASNEEMVAHMKIANWKAPIYNISGLAFDKTEVALRVGEIKPWEQRDNRVVFAARFDQEKQPDFFMDIAEQLNDADIEFAILQGGPLRSNNQKYVDRARALEKAGIITIHENLKKNHYYDIVNRSKVLFNCALQDWVSNTVSEADTLGAMTLFPAYRSFPEVFANNAEQMYIPWSLTDAYEKLKHLLTTYDIPPEWVGKVSDYQDKTIDRTLDVFENPEDPKYLRSGNRYRNMVSVPKY